MKNLSMYLAVLISISSTVRGQGTLPSNSLDKKYGFKDFKFNTEFSILKNNLELYVPPTPITGAQSKIKQYGYKGSCCKELNGVPIWRIALDYYKDKLICIEIGFNTLTDPDFHHLLNSLEASFGQPKIDDSFTNATLYEWTGSKVSASLMRNKNGITTLVFTELALWNSVYLDEY